MKTILPKSIEWSFVVEPWYARGVVGLAATVKLPPLAALEYEAMPGWAELTPAYPAAAEEGDEADSYLDVA